MRRRRYQDGVSIFGYLCAPHGVFLEAGALEAITAGSVKIERAASPVVIQCPGVDWPSAVDALDVILDVLDLII